MKKINTAVESDISDIKLNYDAGQHRELVDYISVDEDVQYSDIDNYISITEKRMIGTVSIVNKTSEKIISVSVAHKYTNKQKNQFSSSKVIDKDAKGEEVFDVDYAVGLSTALENDWWLVSWVSESGKTTITKPHNFRAFIDTIERIAMKIGTPIVAIGGYLTKVLLENKKNGSDKIEIPAWIVAAATIVTTTLIETFLNSESTAGFKKHTLRENDAKDNQIIIYDDKVVFSSNSGKSETSIEVIKCK